MSLHRSQNATLCPQILLISIVLAVLISSPVALAFTTTKASSASSPLFRLADAGISSNDHHGNTGGLFNRGAGMLTSNSPFSQRIPSSTILQMNAETDEAASELINSTEQNNLDTPFVNGGDGVGDTADIETADLEQLIDEEDVVGFRKRWSAAVMTRDSKMDKYIMGTALPSMVNLAVVPLVNAVDTFWVGRMGNALALAGQAAANQAFFTLFFVVNYVPTITAPLVAAAVGSGNTDQARDRVGESLFLCNIFGTMGVLGLALFPQTCLTMVLDSQAPAMQYAIPYLRIRALSMLPALWSSTGFAAFRGLLDTVTPLRVSLATNLLNLVLDPLLMFWTPLSFVGAAFATALSETTSGLVYLKLLFRRKLASGKSLRKIPSLQALGPLLQGGLTMLGRQMALNIGFLVAARKAQALDPTSGVAAAAYGIVMQMYSVGIVVHVAMQGTVAALVPSTLAKEGKGPARRVADRSLAWTSLVGVVLAIGQYALLPLIVPLCSTVPAVQEAVKKPALMVSLLHLVNGPVFAGEGFLLGLGQYRDLMLLTSGSILCMVSSLILTSGAGRLDTILWSILGFNALQAVGVMVHYFRLGPLAVRKWRWRRNRADKLAKAK